MALRQLGFVFSFRAIWAYGFMPPAVGGGGGSVCGGSGNLQPQAASPALMGTRSIRGLIRG